MTKWVIIALCVAVSPGCQSGSHSTQAQHESPPSVAELQAGVPIIGRLGKPLGAVQVVQGRVIRSNDKAATRYLQVQRAGSEVTPECLVIRLSTYITDFGSDFREESAITGRKNLPDLEEGKSYELEGFETGGYVGEPHKALERAGVMLERHSKFGFEPLFVAYAGREIDSIAFTPADSADREMHAKKSAVTVADAESQALIPAADIGTKYIVTGHLGKPLGTIVRVRGQIVDTRMKANDGISCAQVLSINGAEVRESLTLRIHPMFGSFPEGTLTMGKLYDLEGYESGGFSGIPDEAMTRAGTEVATTIHHFGTHFFAYKVVEVQP